MPRVLDGTASDRPAPPRENGLASRLLGLIAIALAVGGVLASAAGVALAVAGEDSWARALTAGPCLFCAGAGLWRLLGNEPRELERLVVSLLLAKAAGVAGIMLALGIPGLVVPGAPHLTWLAIDVAAIAVLVAFRAYFRSWRAGRATARG